MKRASQKSRLQSGSKGKAGRRRVKSPDASAEISFRRPRREGCSGGGSGTTPPVSVAGVRG